MLPNVHIGLFQRRASNHTVLVRIGGSTPSPTLPVISSIGSSLAVNPRSLSSTSFSTAVAGPSVTQLVLTDDVPMQTVNQHAVEAQVDTFSHQNHMTDSEQDAIVASKDGRETQISRCSGEQDTMNGTSKDIQQKDNDSSDTDALQEKDFYYHKDIVVENTQTTLSDLSQIDNKELNDSTESLHNNSILDSQEDLIHDQHHEDNDGNKEHHPENADVEEHPVDNVWSTEHCKEHRTANASRVELRTATAEMRGLETRLADISTTNNILQKELTNLEVGLTYYYVVVVYHLTIVASRHE